MDKQKRITKTTTGACSIAELARRAGVKHDTITRMRNDGLLPSRLFVQSPGGRWSVLDPDAATSMIAEHAITSRAGKPRASLAKPKPKPTSGVQPDISDDADDLEMPDADYAKSRAARESYMAKMAQLDYKAQRGQMVSKAELTTAVFAAGRKIRDNLQQIPGRIAAALAAETDIHLVTLMLGEEIRSSLEELAHDIERIAGDS